MWCMMPSLILMAQEQTSGSVPKKNYLPEEGDFALGIDATPVFKYIGNMFNGNLDNGYNTFGGSPSIPTLNSPTVSILGKYMLTDEFAVRANVGFLIGSVTNRGYAPDDKAQANSLSEDKVVDELRTRSSGGSLALGAEYRKGARRVQGIFGASALFAFQNVDKKYTWGNAITEINQIPSANADMPGYTDHGYGKYRPLKDYNNNAAFYAGIAAHIGVEYFISPKIALGGEVSLTLYKKFGAKQYIISEGFNTTLNKVEERTDLVSPGNSEFHFGTENLGGSIYMMFYF